ncbi:hypothetical protein ECDEC13A_2229, partial [Escherichia coli DEC13A]
MGFEGTGACTIWAHRQQASFGRLCFDNLKGAADKLQLL